MKKIACLVLAASLAMFAAGCGGSPAGGEGESAAPLTGVTLNVFNWGEYIDDEDYKVNDRFTFETGIKVNYKNFTDNESMYAVISSGAAEYDVVFPSDYMVGKMRKEGMLEKINFENVPNFQYIDSTLKNPNYDPTNEYSVPYTWGTLLHKPALLVGFLGHFLAYRVQMAAAIPSASRSRSSAIL